MPTGGKPVPKNMPVWSLLSAIVLIVVLGTVVLLTPIEKLSDPQVAIFFALVVSAVPTLLAAAYAERTSRDIRNGTVVAKVVEAIEEAQVLTRKGPQSDASIESSAHSNGSLDELLRRSEPTNEDEV
jgi:glycerol-3-phosphate acyltransferase PlsY